MITALNKQQMHEINHWVSFKIAPKSAFELNWKCIL